MKLLTEELKKDFSKTGSQNGKGDNAIVLAHFFNPTGRGDWFATEWHEEDRCFYGYVSLFNDHCNEWGYFSLDELESVKVPPFGLGIERDLHFSAEPIKTVCEKRNIYYTPFDK